MSTFTWLLVGHLVGDWLLQNDWMARHKQQSWTNLPLFIHCIVYTFVMVISLWFSAQVLATPAPDYLLFLLLIFTSHWIIDAGNLAQRWGHLFKQSDLLFVRVVVDQILHILVFTFYLTSQ